MDGRKRISLFNPNDLIMNSNPSNKKNSKVALILSNYLNNKYLNKIKIMNECNNNIYKCKYY